ncbi:MAG: hypothetical protein ACKO34_00955 [Vampirovibrionales bacterium]
MFSVAVSPSFTPPTVKRTHPPIQASKHPPHYVKGQTIKLIRLWMR